MFRFEVFADMDPKRRAPRGEGRLDLGRVEGAEIPGGVLRVLLGRRIVGKRYCRFQLEVAGQSQRFVEALFNDGPYPGQNWVEIYDLDLPRALRGNSDFAPDLAPYLQPVADAIPAGGHLMAEYEKRDWHTTQRGLLVGVPPIATPLGAVLFDLGCGDSFKDWYFPEGGMEGSRKLQGNKAYSPKQRREMRAKRASELERFLASRERGPAEIEERARRDARRVLEQLGAFKG